MVDRLAAADIRWARSSKVSRRWSTSRQLEDLGAHSGGGLAGQSIFAPTAGRPSPPPISVGGPNREGPRKSGDVIADTRRVGQRGLRRRAGLAGE